MEYQPLMKIDTTKMPRKIKRRHQSRLRFSLLSLLIGAPFVGAMLAFLLNHPIEACCLAVPFFIFVVQPGLEMIIERNAKQGKDTFLD